jgi:hypothetical protein
MLGGKIFSFLDKILGGDHDLLSQQSLNVTCCSRRIKVRYFCFCYVVSLQSHLEDFQDESKAHHDSFSSSI